MQHLSACLIACLATARGNDPDLTPVFGRDNAAFARGLYRQGFGDLAENFCTKFDAWKDAGGEERAAVRSVHLDIKLDRARGVDDPVARKDQIAEVLKEKEEFIKQFRSTDEANEAELALPDAYRMLGEAFTAALEKTEDLEQVKTLREEGAAAFSHAQEVLRGRKMQLELKINDAALSDKDTETLRDQRAATWFNIARTEYFQTLLYGKDDPERAMRLKNARKTFLDFGLEYDDKLLAYQGYVFQGLIEKALGDEDQAIAGFDQCIALREVYGEGEDGKYPVPLEIDDVISWGVLQKVLYQNELGRHADAIATVDDFFAKSPAPQEAQYGLAVLAAKADAEFKSGDAEAAKATATKLQDLDPNGPWGARGRDIWAQTLGGAGSSGSSDIGARQLLRIAESLVGKGDLDEALRMCARALDAAGTDDDSNVDTLLMMGAIWGRQKDLQAAVVCFDTAWQRHPKAERAADALYRSIDCYVILNGADKRRYYADEIEKRRLKLANEYASSPHAAKVQLLQGRTLEQEQKFSEAADFYLKVNEDSDNYEEAQFSGARCLVKEAQRLIKGKQGDAGKAMVARADAQLRKAMAVLTKSAAETLDLDLRQTWSNQSFDSRTLLANLFMMEGVGRAAEVSKVLEGVEEEFAHDPDKIGQAWSLRIQALNSLGKLDEAEKLLEALLAKNPDSKGSAIAAGVFARSCDSRAMDLLAKDPKKDPKAKAQADEIWKKAFRFYVISLKPKLTDAAAARSGELEQIAGRFFIMGMHFNGIPERVRSFVGWPGGKIVAPEYFQEAAKLYGASLAYVQSYRTRISQARALGFLGRLAEASEIYAKLFEQEALFDASSGELNKQLHQQKPELMAAYLEWGVASLRVALESSSHDVDLLARANQVFKGVVDATKPTSREPSETWWHARYWQIRAWIDEGEYAKAELALRDLERNTNDFDEGKYGLRDLFKQMKNDMIDKQPTKNIPPKTDKPPK